MRKIRQDSNSSMSSTRLEEIISALMKPPKDIRQNFEMDISSLLHEYMTEADQIFHENNQQNLNFSEAALLLQQSANIYGKKVDYLWSQVLEILNSFGTVNRSQDDDETQEEQATDQQQRPRIKKKQEPQLIDFLPIKLEEASNISIKKNIELKPLATLPKNFIQFEPRTISEHDVHIMDYNEQLIGVMSDFRVNWNSDENGMLVDDLDMCADIQSVVGELSEDTVEECTLTAAAQDTFDDSTETFDDDTLTQPNEETTIVESSSINITTAEEASTIIPNTPDVTVLETTVEMSNQKKRKIFDKNTPVRRKCSKYDITRLLTPPSANLRSVNCYFVQPNWMQKLIERRKSKFVKLKNRVDTVSVEDEMLDSEHLLDVFALNSQCDLEYESEPQEAYQRNIFQGIKILGTPWQRDFIGFNPDRPAFTEHGINGFVGFKTAAFGTPDEFSSLSVLYQSFLGEDACNNQEKPTSFPPSCFDDDDDDNDHHGDDNFEDLCQPLDQSIGSVLHPEILQPEINTGTRLTEQSDVTKRVEAWHTSIREKLVRAEQRQNFDIWSYSSRVLKTFQTSGDSVISFRDVVKKKPQEDIARYLLATLMLANSSNVEVEEVSTEGCGNFQMRLLSMEKQQIEEDYPF